MKNSCTKEEKENHFYSKDNSFSGSQNSDKPANQKEMTEAAQAAGSLSASKGVDLNEHCNNNNYNGEQARNQ
uniref:Uncharacterized protein n=1 Tax=Romanomermis culicivorax TaxID=13658 RepID=A0A915I1L7_ROMCU